MTEHDPRFELIQRCWDGQASPDELAQLEAELTSDAAFRRHYLSLVNIDQALASGMRKSEDAVEIPLRDAAPRANPSRSIWSWGPWVSAAAGVVVGFFFTSIAWAVAGIRDQAVNAPDFEQLLFEESFESSAISWEQGFPEGADVWGGAPGEVVLQSKQPAPEHGVGVARIEPVEETQLSYLTRIIEVDDLPPTTKGEIRQLEVFASFHANEPRFQERYTIRLATFDEDPSSIHSLWAGPAWPKMRDRTLTMRKSGLSTTSDAVGWQTLSAVVEIPDETRCIVISLAAGRRDVAAPKSAHYFDNVQANVVIRQKPKRPKRKR